MSKKIITYVIILLIAIALLVGIFVVNKQNKNTEEELKLVKVNEVTRSVFYAPQYVAINNGYFKEKEMNIELSTGQGAETPLPC